VLYTNWNIKVAKSCKKRTLTINQSINPSEALTKQLNLKDAEQSDTVQPKAL